MVNHQGDSSFLRQMADSFGMTGHLLMGRKGKAIRPDGSPSLSILPKKELSFRAQRGISLLLYQFIS
jgi:hypothetical protein